MQTVTDQLNEGVKIQQSSAYCLQFMVQDLLDYAQIKQGKFRKIKVLFNIKEAIEEVMMIQKRKALDNNINFHSSFEGEQMLETDKQRVMQVLLCLQSNALKFTQNGEVHIYAKVTSTTLSISVKDSGIGISKEN